MKKISLWNIFWPIALILCIVFLFLREPGVVTFPTSWDSQEDDAMREHCQMMPEMAGCEKYTGSEDATKMKHTMMDHSSMVTSEESFVANMIPHHQEAIDTARLVVTRGENSDLRELAQNIITAQEKEIKMMNQWETEWKYSAVPTYQNMMGDGTKLSGKELDSWFLHGMIMHHMGAVQMAEAVLTLNPRKEISDFAREVIRAQTLEIQQMLEMLGMSNSVGMMN